MHLHNIERGKSGHPDYVNKFGFHVRTSCGSIPQKNAWKNDWKVKYVLPFQLIPVSSTVWNQKCHIWVHLQPIFKLLLEPFQLAQAEFWIVQLIEEHYILHFLCRIYNLELCTLISGLLYWQATRTDRFARKRFWYR